MNFSFDFTFDNLIVQLTIIGLVILVIIQWGLRQLDKCTIELCKKSIISHTIQMNLLKRMYKILSKIDEDAYGGFEDDDEEKTEITEEETKEIEEKFKTWKDDCKNAKKDAEKERKKVKDRIDQFDEAFDKTIGKKVKRSVKKGN